MPSPVLIPAVQQIAVEILRRVWQVPLEKPCVILTGTLKRKRFNQSASHTIADL